MDDHQLRRDDENYTRIWPGHRATKMFESMYEASMFVGRALELPAAPCKQVGDRQVEVEWIEGDNLADIVTSEILLEFLEWCRYELWQIGTKINTKILEDHYIDRGLTPNFNEIYTNSKLVKSWHGDLKNTPRSFHAT